MKTNRLRNTLLTAAATVIAACHGSAPADSAASARDALSAQPDDPSLRVEAARQELARGDGLAAEILLKQAVDRGYPRSQALGMLAEALRIQNDPDRTLRELPDPAPIDGPADVAVALARLEAKAQLPDYPSADIARDVQMLAALAESTAPLAALAARYETVAAAVQSATCASGQDMVVWQPAPYPKGRRVLQVGANGAYRTLAEATKQLRDGDVIEIEAGEYRESVLIKANDVWIRGVNGRPHLKAPPQLLQDKAILVIRGSNTVIENLEFSGARNRALNGAGIRSQGPGLVVRASYFHDNDNGILTSHDPTSRVVVEFSEFARNGHGDGKSHNLYVGRVDRFEMRYSYSHGAKEGHLVKSRAAHNVIEYNLLADDGDSTASYEIDLPLASDAIVMGNLIVQAATSPNQSIISYAAEKQAQLSAPTGTLTVAYNTVYSRRENPIFVNNRSTAPAVVANNVFGGARGREINGPAVQYGNRIAVKSDFVDVDRGDFRLVAGAAAIDAAEEKDATPIPAPTYEPGSDANARRRQQIGRIDAGAFEYCPPTVSPKTE